MTAAPTTTTTTGRARRALIALCVVLVALVAVGGSGVATPVAHAAPAATTGPTPDAVGKVAKPTPAKVGSSAAGGSNPGLSISLNGKDGGTSTAVQLLVLFTVLGLAPSILILMTGFTRILIVLGFVRNALGTPSMPPNQILIGISMFLTLFVMFPTFKSINEHALQPYVDHKISQSEALETAQQPIREFMFKQVGTSDLALFVKLAHEEKPKTKADVPTHVLIPAFLISELKTAFQIGFLIYIPFLIIDMVVASTLMSMGMVMLPPVTISLPFKILLFVLVDGWHLTIESLITGFH